MAELTYDVTIAGMRLTVRCYKRPIPVSAAPGKCMSEYFDIALEAIKADGREIVEVVPAFQSGMAVRNYQIRTKPAAAAMPEDPQP